MPKKMSYSDQKKIGENSVSENSLTSKNLKKNTSVQNSAEEFIAFIGQSVAWLTLAMAFLTVLVVILRSTFNIGAIALQETIVYFHAAVFLLGSAFTLLTDGHVRVDVFYRRFRPKNKAKVDLFGTLFLLLPTAIFILFYCWQYVMNSWAILEKSQESSGLPLVFILKSLMLGLPILLFIQGCSHVITLIGKIRSPHPSQQRTKQH